MQYEINKKRKEKDDMTIKSFFIYIEKHNIHIYVRYLDLYYIYMIILYKS